MEQTRWKIQPLIYSLLRKFFPFFGIVFPHKGMHGAAVVTSKSDSHNRQRKSIVGARRTAFGESAYANSRRASSVKALFN